jgi:hypothetical protein
MHFEFIAITVDRTLGIAKGGRGGKTNLQCPCVLRCRANELKWSHRGRRGEVADHRVPEPEARGQS